MATYSFKNTYQQDWNEFISNFHWDDSSDELPNRAKEWCIGLHTWIETLYKEAPEYSTQMEIRWYWYELKEILEEEKENLMVQKALGWFCQQIANMIICDDMRINESIWYALGVDYFECGTDGYWLFLPLYQILPEEKTEQLIQYSCSIDWPAKKEAYHEIAKNEKDHAALADALLSSCNAYCFGAMKASEGLELLAKLEIKASLHKKVFDMLSSPIEVEVMEVININPKGGIKSLLSIQGIAVSIFPTWFPYAELWVDDENLGSLEECYLGNNWEYIAKEHSFTPPDTYGRILELSSTQLLHLKGKKGWLKPL